MAESSRGLVFTRWWLVNARRLGFRGLQLSYDWVDKRAHFLVLSDRSTSVLEDKAVSRI
jgi:hypothetical protein